MIRMISLQRTDQKVAANWLKSTITVTDQMDRSIQTTIARVIAAFKEEAANSSVASLAITASQVVPFVIVATTWADPLVVSIAYSFVHFSYKELAIAIVTAKVRSSLQALLKQSEGELVTLRKSQKDHQDQLKRTSF